MASQAWSITRDPLHRPGDNVLPFRKMKLRSVTWQRDSQAASHSVDANICFCLLQAPRRMVNIQPENARSSIGGVQTITLGQEVVERSRRRPEHRTRRTIRCD